MKLSESVEFGSDFELVHDCEFNALGMATSNYKGRKVLSFLSDAKYLDAILTNHNITGFICNKEVLNSVEIPNSYGVMLANKPKLAFYEIHNKLSKLDFYWERFENRIAETAKISVYSQIGENSIKIGDNSVIESGVIIHPGTIIGNNVTIRSGSQIGTSGFQFLNNGKEVLSVNTAGRVIIDDNVEIQHNCCLDRGVLGGDTVIGKHVKLDNFVHIAHDDYIGERTFITAGVKLAGRVTIGKDCWLGVNATISNGITIGDNCKISLGSVVTKDVETNTIVSGNFAIDHKKFIQHMKAIR